MLSVQLQLEEEEEGRGRRGRLCPHTRPWSSDAHLSWAGGAGGGLSVAFTGAGAGGALPAGLEVLPTSTSGTHGCGGAELAALLPFGEAAQDVQARGRKTEEEAVEAANADHVFGAAFRPLVLQTNARRMRGFRVDVGHLKKIDRHSREKGTDLVFSISFLNFQKRQLYQDCSFLNLNFQILNVLS